MYCRVSAPLARLSTVLEQEGAARATTYRIAEFSLMWWCKRAPRSAPSRSHQIVKRLLEQRISSRPLLPLASAHARGRATTTPTQGRRRSFLVRIGPTLRARALTAQRAMEMALLLLLHTATGWNSPMWRPPCAAASTLANRALLFVVVV